MTGAVIPNPEAGLINVRATAKQHEAVQAFVDRVMASVQRQVLIEATVVEVNLEGSVPPGDRLAGDQSGDRFGRVPTADG